MECPICDKNIWKYLDYLRDREYWIDKDILDIDENVNFKICKNCGFVTYDYVSDEVLAERYNNERPVMTPQNIITCNRKNEYHKKFLNIEENSIEGIEDPYCLDVGCAQGGFLGMLKDHGIKRLYGVEFNKAFAAWGRNEYGLRIDSEIGKDENGREYVQAVKELRIEPLQYDFISYYHVLEHMQHPDKELKKIKKLLKDDGFLYLSIPHWFTELEEKGGSLCNDFENYYHLNHVNVFTINSFKNLLYRTGFKIVREDHKMYGYTVLCQKTDKVTGIVTEDYNLIEYYLQIQKQAIELFKQGKFPEAFKLCPTYTDAYLQEIMKSDVAKEFDKQRGVLEKALEIMPDNLKIKNSLAKMYYQWDMNTPNKQYFSNNLKRAEKILLEIIEAKPGSEDCYYFLGMIEGKYKKNYTKARELFSKVIEINPQMYNEIMQIMASFWKEKDARLT